MKVIRGVAMVVLVAMISFVFVLYVDAREQAHPSISPQGDIQDLSASR
jgi:hypothetical protein